ncbi:MAG: hypothetical protein WBF53_06225 [Litorimonas sp.]
MALAMVGVMLLVACGGNIGPDRDDLVGRWAQAPTAEQIADSAGAVRVEDVVVEYRADGTSRLDGRLVVSRDEAEPLAFELNTDVAWSLDETVLTRTLRGVSLTPADPSPDAAALARELERQYGQVPPGRQIVEALDAGELVVTDVETGERMRFTRLGGPE